MALIYDEPDKVAYCSVPKVASSTWCWHFTQLANMSQEEAAKRKQVLQTFAPNLWPAPAIEDGLEEAWARTTSLVIVRHPLSRWAPGLLLVLPWPCMSIGWCPDTIRSLSNWPSMVPGLPRSRWSLRDTGTGQTPGTRSTPRPRSSSDTSWTGSGQTGGRQTPTGGPSICR